MRRSSAGFLFSYSDVPVCPIDFTVQQVFQTFSCVTLDETGEKYLWADLRIRCDSLTYRNYRVYAAVMIIICECWLRVAHLVFLEQNHGEISRRSL